MRSPNRIHERSNFFKYMSAKTAKLVLGGGNGILKPTKIPCGTRELSLSGYGTWVQQKAFDLLRLNPAQ
jgi:hypothetical protein